MTRWPPSVFEGLDLVCVEPEATIRDAIACIDLTERAIALVVDRSRCLLDTITDGDIRRALLAGTPLTAPVGSLRSRRHTCPYPTPVTAHVSSDPADVLRMMDEQRLRQIPLLNDRGEVVGLVMRHELAPSEAMSVAAVVMAGGQGARLRPLTADTPKPMLPVAGRPLMERTIARLKDAGICRVSIATHYQSEKIVEHFGDGRAFGVDLSYVNEDRPLGTAGALALMAPPRETLLVMNGDIVTDVDFRAMHEYHRQHHADLTVAVRAYQFQVPYGVIESDGASVLGLREKPELNFFVNAGIYLLEPAMLAHIPRGIHFDMTDLIRVSLERGSTVVSFLVHEYWLDIGEPDGYLQAQRDLGASAATGNREMP